MIDLNCHILHMINYFVAERHSHVMLINVTYNSKCIVLIVLSRLKLIFYYCEIYCIKEIHKTECQKNIMTISVLTFS